MFSLIRHLGLEQAIRREGVPLGGAWLIAELFYKFHSFTLECVAFLATWFALSAVFFGLRRLLGAADPRT